MNHAIELYAIAYHFLALWSIYSSSLTLIGDLVLGSVSPFPPQHLLPTAHWRASLLFFDFLYCNNLHHFTLVICSYGHILDPGFFTFWDFKIKQLSLWLWFALLRDLWFSNSPFNPKGLFNSIFLYFLPFSPFLPLRTFLSSFLCLSIIVGLLLLPNEPVEFSGSKSGQIVCPHFHYDYIE